MVNWSLFVLILVVSVLFKLLLIPAYHSTDFEVHRNWLAITNSLPISKWYYENTSEWTLDYPPFFAYFEYALSKPAKLIDPDMVRVDNLNYKSTQTVHYQRISVIVTEFVLVFGLVKYLKFFERKVSKKVEKEEIQLLNSSTFLAVQFLLNFGLIVVDNIHFQYNGFLYGLMILSMYFIQNENWLIGSFLFSSLINFKHIYLYVAPAYFFYILFFYCLKGDGIANKFMRLASIGVFAILPFVISLGPFIWMKQMDQLVSRLFPFKRGLSHAYWAPNVWALYNFVDKAASIALKKRGGSTTGGLVQDVEHVVLPNVAPLHTFILSFVFMIVPLALLLAKTFKTKKSQANNKTLAVFIVVCAYSSFLFGWHVHEKAILNILLPLSLLSVLDAQYSSLYFFMTVISNYSLFPLIFTSFEYPIKVSLLILTTLYNYVSLKYQYKESFHVNKLEFVWISLIVFIEVYNNLIHVALGLDQRLQFLPLMVISVYTALGVVYSWSRFIFISIKSN